MSGFTLNLFGWDMLNWIVFPVVAFCLILLGLLAFGSRSSAATHAGE